MGIKIAIVVLFFAIIACLSSSFVFLLKDIGIAESKRTLYALGVRITLAAALLALIAYGIQTGKLANQAPWDQVRKSSAHPASVPQQTN